MEHQERGSSILPLSALLLALGLGSYYLYEQPYESLRPQEETPAAQHSSSEEVDARLWEDPFEPLYRAPAPSACRGVGSPTPWRIGGETGDLRPAPFEVFREVTSHQVLHLADEVGRQAALAESSEGRLVLLPVLVPGGPYAEQAEKRRRMRYAVVAGLGAAGYVPQVSDHVGYVETCWDLGGLHPDSGRSIYVPYEWFEPDTLRSLPDRGKASAVLLLWLDEGEISADPWGMLDDLLGHLVGYCPPAAERAGGCAATEPLGKRFSFALIGPSTSDFLARLINPNGPGTEPPPPSPSPSPVMKTQVGDDGEDAPPAPSAPAVAANTLVSCLVDRFAASPGEPRRDCAPRTVPSRWSASELPEPPSNEHLARAGAVEAVGTELGEALAKADADYAPRSRQTCDEKAPLCKGILEALGDSDQVSARGPSLAERAAHLLAAVTERVVRSRDRSPEWEDPTQVAEEVAVWIGQHRDLLFGSTRLPASVRPHLSIFVSRATAPAALLLAGQAPSRSVESWDAELATLITNGNTNGAGGVAKFASVIGRDDQLAAALVDELARRGVDLCKPDGQDHVALVGEWDTFYGRALPLALEAAVLTCRGEAGPTLDDALLGLLRGEIAPPGRVERFNYLRGLDGAAPRPGGGGSGFGGDPAAGAAGRGAPEDGLLTRLPWSGGGTVERAVGNRQFDYMRRLAGQLTQRQRELRDGGQAIRAIGVVGTDVYDKLLVLQALRERFPQTLFFTTDLDSRLAHPSDYRWNRNLLVASSFGLSLREDLQPRIPPFRDSYQTATFLAVRLALAGVDPFTGRHSVPDGKLAARPEWQTALRLASFVPSTNLADEETSLVARVAGLPARKRLALFADQPWVAMNVDQLRPLPRVFELGRSGPYDLSADGDVWGLHPHRRPGKPSASRLGSFAAIALLGLILLVPVVPGLRRFTLGRWSDVDHRERFYVNLVTVLVLVVTLMYWRLVFIATRDGGGEPFELWEGISIWPTEALRLVALLLAVSFIALGTVRLKKNAEDIERRFGLQRGKRWELPSIWSRWWTARRVWKIGLSRRLLGFGKLKPLRATRVMRYAARPLVRERRSWWRWRKLVSINLWRSDRERDAEGGHSTVEGKTDGSDVWDRYRYLGRLGHRLTRFLPVAILYWLLGRGIVLLLGQPHLPYRGDLVASVDKVVLIASVLSVIALTFFVVDATRLCERFIQTLTDRRTEWRPEVVQEAKDTMNVVEPRDAGDFLDLEIIADRTEAVGRLIVYPFVVLFLMIVSRASVFDNWDWPLSLLLILTMASCYALLCAVVLRRAAEEARRKVIERLRGNLFEAVREEDREDGPRASQIRLLIDEARRMKRGAFAHWSHHPVIRAVLLPFGGIGAVALIELLAALSR